MIQSGMIVNVFFYAADCKELEDIWHFSGEAEDKLCALKKECIVRVHEKQKKSLLGQRKTLLTFLWQNAWPTDRSYSLTRRIKQKKSSSWIHISSYYTLNFLQGQTVWLLNRFRKQTELSVSDKA